MPDLSEFDRSVLHERRRVANIMLNYDPKTYKNNCDCDDCLMFAEWLNIGFPLSWLEGHDIPTGS